MRSVFAKALWDQRLGIVGWTIGIVAVGVLYAAFYPTMNTPGLTEFMENFPAGMLEAMGLSDFASPAGYIGSTTYGILGPILMLAFGSALGIRAIAGDEEAGLLDVLLAHPIERSRFLVERAAAMVVAVAIVGFSLFLVMVAIAGFVGFEENRGSQLRRRFDPDRPAWVFLRRPGPVRRCGDRQAVVGRGQQSAIVGVLSYFANTLGPSIDLLRWTRHLSPFHSLLRWAAPALRNPVRRRGGPRGRNHRIDRLGSFRIPPT